MEITLLAVGKLRPSLRDVADDYVCRLGRYVKLREVLLTYSLPASLMKKMGPVKNISISAVGRNLWLIHKKPKEIS